jgi:hypothetical protein
LSQEEATAGEVSEGKTKEVVVARLAPAGEVDSLTLSLSLAAATLHHGLSFNRAAIQTCKCAVLWGVGSAHLSLSSVPFWSQFGFSAASLCLLSVQGRERG